MRRILIAGMGNLLRGDDGFGVRVVERLSRMSLPAGTETYEAGGAGVALAQKLSEGFDACILIDATERRGVPGTLYRLTPCISGAPREIGMHDLDPSRVLALARAMGALPSEILLIGCEPAQTEELCGELSAPVAAAVEHAVATILREVARLTN